MADTKLQIISTDQAGCNVQFGTNSSAGENQQVSLDYVHNACTATQPQLPDTTELTGLALYHQQRLQTSVEKLSKFQVNENSHFSGLLDLMEVEHAVANLLKDNQLTDPVIGATRNVLKATLVKLHNAGDSSTYSASERALKQSLIDGVKALSSSLAVIQLTRQSALETAKQHLQRIEDISNDSSLAFRENQETIRWYADSL